MSETTPPDAEQPRQPPPFDPAAEHHVRPKLRRVRGFGARTPDGQTVLGLADASQICDRIVFAAPQVQQLLPLMDGTRSIDQIVAEVGRGLTTEIMQGLVAQLDDAGLLHGPTFDRIWSKVKSDYDSADVLPPGATAAFADMLVMQELGREATEEQKREQGPQRLRAAMDQWIDKALEKAEDPSFDALPRAVVSPHIDYARGWVNYGALWGRMRVVDRPDRVVILGTNHHGRATGVCGCDKGFESPLGFCPLDAELADRLRAELGDALYAERYDHEREHSVELQIPWIQHCLGADERGEHCKVWGCLVHDPLVNNGQSYDGNGVALDPFVEALKKVLGELGGKTLIVASADLSHVGPMFGDQHPLAGDAPEAVQARERIMAHDREMVEMLRAGKTEELLASMAWQQNHTRWCSLGNLLATWRIVEPTHARILSYAASMDQQGAGMVSSCAMVLN